MGEVSNKLFEEAIWDIEGMQKKYGIICVVNGGAFPQRFKFDEKAVYELELESMKIDKYIEIRDELYIYSDGHVDHVMSKILDADDFSNASDDDLNAGYENLPWEKCIIIRFCA